VVESALRATDPAGWTAVEFLRDTIAAEAGVAPSHALIGLGTRVDSVAERDSLRAKATMKKLATGDLLRRREGRVVGLFNDAQWEEFKQAVADGRGEEVLKKRFGKPEGLKLWAESIAKLGQADQTGKAAFRGKDTKGLAVELSLETPGISERMSKEVVDDETGGIPLSPETRLPPEQLRAVLKANDVDVDAAIAEMREYEDLTRNDVYDILDFGPEHEAYRRRAQNEGDAFREGIVNQLLALKEHEDLSSGADGGGIRSEEGGVLRTPGKPTGRYSQPLVDAQWRAGDGEVARAWGETVAALQDAGIAVNAVQAAINDVDAFYRQTGGRTDGRRFIELVLKDVTRPGATDLEVAVHEAVHVLFAAQPEAMRAALHRAVAKLPDPDPALNESLTDPDPIVRSEEKLAVTLQGDGMTAGQAKDLASRLMRFVRDLYLRVARTFATLLGAREQADAFALRYFRNRLQGLLQGDYAPQSLANALGGRPLTFTERAVMLPGFGRTLGRMLNGGFEWAPKVPDSFEAIAHNLDIAFSRPPQSEAEANLRKGVDAVNQILADRTKVIKGAMYRPEVGSVTFEWGNPGDPNKAFRAGYGIGHILARRALVGGMKPEEAIASLIETIAYGDASAPYGGEGDTRVQITEGNNIVVLSLARHGKRETWAITSMERHDGSAKGASDKSGPSSKATQAAPAFSQDDLVALADKLRLGARLRVVNAAGMRYSRPRLSTEETPIGAVDNPANAINRDVATLNHAIAVEQTAMQAVASEPAIAQELNKLTAAQQNPANWLRAQFGFEDPEALKAAVLGRLDPQTGQPAQGVNPAQVFGDFADVSNAAPARIHAYTMLWNRMKAMSRRLTEAREEVARLQNRHAKAQQEFLDAHRNYLNAEGLTALVLKGVRQLIARERKLSARLNGQMGVLMQQLRELDGRSEETIDREYAGVFKKLFIGKELRGRHLFDLLDQLVNEANIDFQGKITEIRQKLAERHAAGMASPEMAMLLASTPESRALLATVVAYGKTNASVLAQIERRRMKNAQERAALQQKLDALIAERTITSQAVTDLPKTAKLEERARMLYVQAKRRIRAIDDEVKARELRIKAAEKAMPVYRAAIESLSRELGGIRPDYTFADGMVYRVPVPNQNGGVDLAPKTLSLTAGKVTDRAALDRDLKAMTEWLGLKERMGELDHDYRDVWAARHALLEGGYWESDLRKTDLWVRGNIFMPVGAKAGATGLPSGRIVEQMFNKFASVENALRAEGQRLGERANRLRDAAVAVLNRGRKRADMTVDRYYSEIAEPAMSIIEKATDLLELGLTREQAMTRAYQRIIRHLLQNPSIEPFIRGKEQAVTAALRAHLDAVAAASKFYNDANARHGLGVRDERLITERGDGIEAAGVRDSLPVGLQTFSRRLSARAGRVYRIMRGAGWGGMTDVIPNVAELYSQGGPNAVRQTIAAFFADPIVLEDFVGALATTDTFSPFDAPVLKDGVTRPEADPARVALAWREAAGDVVAFIEAMYDLHGGATDRGRYVQDVLARMRDYYAHLGEMLDSSESGMVPDGLKRLTSNLMIDARTLDRWPTAWSEHLMFDPQTNHQLARRVAAQVAFGRDTERLAQAWDTLEKDLAAARAEYEAIVAREQRAGFTGRKLRQRVEADYVARLGAKGKAEFARVERLAKLQPVIREAKEQVRAFFSSKHNQLDAVRFASQLGSTVAFGMLNNAGTAADGVVTLELDLHTQDIRNLGNALGGRRPAKVCLEVEVTKDGAPQTITTLPWRLAFEGIQVEDEPPATVEENTNTAAQHAATATEKAEIATEKAGEAADSASEAEGHAQTATTKAGEAAASAGQADAAKIAAEAAKTAAESAAGTATTKASEAADAAKRDDYTPNAMWAKRTWGQIEKCAEAAALRAAFPEEIGGVATAEEMHGRATDDEGLTVVTETNANAENANAGPASESTETKKRAAVPKKNKGAAAMSAAKSPPSTGPIIEADATPVSDDTTAAPSEPPPPTEPEKPAPAESVPAESSEPVKPEWPQTIRCVITAVKDLPVPGHPKIKSVKAVLLAGATCILDGKEVDVASDVFGRAVFDPEKPELAKFAVENPDEYLDLTIDRQPSQSNPQKKNNIIIGAQVAEVFM